MVAEHDASSSTKLGRDMALAFLSGSRTFVRGAKKFLNENATMIVAWRLAGLSNRDIAEIITSCGFPLAAKSLNTMMKGIRARADMPAAHAMAESIRVEILANMADRAVGALRSGRPLPAAGSSAIPCLANRADPGPSPARLPGALAMQFEPIAGEDDDMSDRFSPGVPRSFGDMRRRLWDAATGPGRSRYFHFEDGHRLEIPKSVHRELFCGRIPDWARLFERLEGARVL